MARTKQTARKCLVSQAMPKKILKTNSRKGVAYKKDRKKRNKENKISDSESQNDQLDQEVDQVNNQQFSVRFDDQASCQQHAVPGNFIPCMNCGAILTIQSKMYSQDEYNKLKQNPSLSDSTKQKFLKGGDFVWICEFCLTHNAIKKTYKLPKVQNPCFLIEKVKQKKDKKQSDDDSNKVLIFCIDISGSMQLQVHGQKSRLDTVKEAIIDEINRMKFQNETIKVGLVTFGFSVTLVGDGKTFKQKNLPSEIYQNFDKIIEEASKINNFASPITKSFSSLKKRIGNLNVFGSTALGPGLLASIQIASKGGVGSKVIICTDGEANVGVGSTYGPNSSLFYEKAADFAKKKGVTVSILSLKGDRCNLKQLGKLSLASGGSILKIQPSALGTQFSKIAKQQILGTSSELVIKVNKIFEIVSHIPDQLSADRTTLTQSFGSFSDQTEEQAAKKPGVDLELYKQSRFPMQVHLTYIGRNGNKYMQVITDWRQGTENEKEIYEGAHFGLFAASVLQRASSKIKAQQFTQAEKIIQGYWSIVNQNFVKSQTQLELKRFGDRVRNLQAVLNSKLRKNGQATQSKVSRKKSRDRSRNKKISSKQKQKKIAKRKSKEPSESEPSVDQMSSDQQEQILYKQMRARSRSNSPETKEKPKTRAKRV